MDCFRYKYLYFVKMQNVFLQYWRLFRVQLTNIKNLSTIGVYVHNFYTGNLYTNDFNVIRQYIFINTNTIL